MKRIWDEYTNTLSGKLHECEQATSKLNERWQLWQVSETRQLSQTYVSFSSPFLLSYFHSAIELPHFSSLSQILSALSPPLRLNQEATSPARAVGSQPDIASTWLLQQLALSLHKDKRCQKHQCEANKKRKWDGVGKKGGLGWYNSPCFYVEHTAAELSSVM